MHERLHASNDSEPSTVSVAKVLFLPKMLSVCRITLKAVDEH